MTLAKRPIDELKERFADEGLRAALVKLLPKHISLERLCAVALNAASQNPILLQCSPNSIIRALLAGAQLGLEPGGPLGAAYMVPYRNRSGGYEAQLIPGYRGLIELARRSGVVKHIEARCVYSMDECTIKYGLEPSIEHVPGFVDDDKLQKVYAVAILSDGGKIFEVMTKTQVEAIRSRSRAQGGGPWVTDYEEMAKKTVVRRLCKYLPLAVELSTALELENSAEEGTSLVDIPQLAEHTEPAETQTEKLKKRIEFTKKPFAQLQGAISPTRNDILADPVSFTPGEAEGVDAAFDTEKPQNPTIEEVRLKAAEQAAALIMSLFDKLEYSARQRTELGLKYSGKERDLIKHLEKAVENRSKLAEAQKA